MSTPVADGEPTGQGRGVLLVFCAPSNRALYVNALPPLGVLTIASYLEARHIRVDVVDGQIDDVERIDARAYGVIGFSINTANVKRSLEVMARLKREHPGARIVAGGPHCKSDPEFFLRKGFIDAVCVDEGEQAMYEYVAGATSIPGMYVKTEGGPPLYPGPRPYLETLDDLPFPALDKVDLSKYRYYPRRRTPISSIMTSRGCPFGCIFCFQTHGRRWRMRSAENVVDEIEWQVTALGVAEIAVYDDNFSLDRGRVLRICELLVARGVRVSLQFTNGLRVENLDAEVLTALKRAGTWLIGVAPDTGTPRVMAQIGKHVDLQQVRATVKRCKALGIRTFAFFILGFPDETAAEIEQTIRYAIDLDTDMAQFARVLAYKGTKLFDAVDTRSYDHGEEIGYFYESTANTGLTRDVRRAYRRFYMRPRKLVGLLRMHAWRDVVTLARYAVRTKSI